VEYYLTQTLDTNLLDRKATDQINNEKTITIKKADTQMMKMEKV